MQVSAPLSLGTNRIVLNVIDPNFSIGAATTTTTVVDTRPPMIPSLPTLTIGTCSGAATVVTLTPTVSLSAVPNLNGIVFPAPLLFASPSS